MKVAIAGSYGLLCQRPRCPLWVADPFGQEAPWLETLALVDLCETKVATKEDRLRLSALVDGLPEASGTSLLKRARELVAAR